MKTKWPKQLKELSPELREKAKNWEADWLPHMNSAYGFVPRFNEAFLKAVTPKLGANPTVLEIGPGLSNQVRSLLSHSTYYCIERRNDFCEEIRKVVPAEHVFHQVAEERVPVDDHFFDAVLAIHLLEHLRNLPATLREIRRILKPNGHLFAVIPCEGSPFYSLGRQLTVARRFRRRFGAGYGDIIRSEHVNTAREVLEELKKQFRIEASRMYPFNLRVAGLFGNLLAGFDCRPLA
jgi:SAM-dependent methyltransferase